MLTDPLSTLAQDLERGFVSPQIYGDPELHQLELERVFGSSWNFVALEDEIRSPGDYVLRTIGEDEVVVCRDNDGEVHVLLNKCRHRGTKICRDDKGNTSHFRCPYHGWTYGNDGRWTGAPKRRQAYQELDPSEWGLLEAPRVERRWSLIFANLDENAPSFDEDLGEMAWFLDGFLGLDSRGLRLIGEPTRWVTPNNWKSGSENTGGDNYHAITTHSSYMEILGRKNAADGMEMCTQWELGNGHMFTAFNSVGDHQENTGPYGYPLDVWESFDKYRVTDEHLELLRKYHPSVSTLFPNLNLSRSPGPPDPVTGVRPMTTGLTLNQPVGHNKTIVWRWFCAYQAESDATDEAGYVSSLAVSGPAGLIVQDDTEVWTDAPLAAKSVMARKLGMKYNYQMGLNGMSAGGTPSGFNGPGRIWNNAFNEGNQRGFLRRWLKMMAG